MVVATNVGISVGDIVGAIDGITEGETEGFADGDCVGTVLSDEDGIEVGIIDEYSTDAIESSTADQTSPVSSSGS